MKILFNLLVLYSLICVALGAPRLFETNNENQASSESQRQNEHLKRNLWDPNSCQRGSG